MSQNDSNHLPFIPEPIESLRDRLPKALEKLWVRTESNKYDEERPGKYRTYVFDFYNGLRLIISKDKYILNSGEYEEFVHLSSSWEVVRPITLTAATTEVKSAWKRIGGKGIPEVIGVSIAGILHFKIEDPKAKSH